MPMCLDFWQVQAGSLNQLKEITFMPDGRVPQFALTTISCFTSWLDLGDGSLAFRTHQGKKVFVLPRQSGVLQAGHIG